MDMLDEGESKASAEVSSTSDNIQHVMPIIQALKTPLQTTQPLPILKMPRTNWVRPPVGYYQALNEGERASAVILDVLEESKENLINEEATYNHSKQHILLAATEPEPTLQQALNGPDAKEWQQAIAYEMLEMVSKWNND